ncbi:Meiotic recombination protein SPO11-1 [Capsicum baccatum]|uniref:Meiotic recombination protein SPO11-1 n=1 Tax=Capsicum baccatum TaxID=33114 RepID=A0A2G2WFH4_CAPBA|nr:Meiotic recombination protein SPO11-1 [Capsicum baccatum]
MRNASEGQEGFTRSIVEDLARGNAPLIYIDRFRNYCTGTSGNCSCSSGLPTGKEAISLKRECHVRRLDILLRVLLIVQQLLQENRHGSKRDIYYMHPTVFKEQSVVDRAINDICILLQCSRHNLNVLHVLFTVKDSKILHIHAFDMGNGSSQVSERPREPHKFLALGGEFCLIFLLHDLSFSIAWGVRCLLEMGAYLYTVHISLQECAS